MPASPDPVQHTLNAPPLRGMLRGAAIVTLLLGALSGTFAATEAMALGSLERMEWTEHPATTPLLVDRAVGQHIAEAQAASLETMRTSRGILLSASAVCCALMTIASIRLLRPRGIPRDIIRRALGVVAIVAAVLRTMDGAQGAVVARHVGKAMAPSLVTLTDVRDPLVLAQVRDALPGLLTGVSALQTAAVAGLMLVLGQYFRSNRARAQIEGLSRPPSLPL